MNGRDVATRMRAIEDNITGETGEDAPPLDRVVGVLLELDYDDLNGVLHAEIDRVMTLIDGWYTTHGAPATKENIAALSFVQGVTFSVAAHRLRFNDLRRLTDRHVQRDEDVIITGAEYLRLRARQWR